jgi:hypothetical protein
MGSKEAKKSPKVAKNKNIIARIFYNLILWKLVVPMNKQVAVMNLFHRTCPKVFFVIP